MKTYTHEKSFIFHHQAEGLASVVRSCVQYIEEQNELLGVPQDIHAKIKWIITELLINGIKHSGSEKSTLNFKFSDTGLVIEKEDEGSPLQLTVNGGTQNLLWPLEKHLIHEHFEVYRNGMDSLEVYTENEKAAIFKIREAEEEEMPILLINTSEHFGLMIIAKASDHFSYFMDSSGKNIFHIHFTYLP
jgi:anti-sigma regulatory factor (Ser/Thr protein kinase)